LDIGTFPILNEMAAYIRSVCEWSNCIRHVCQL